jgi:hypothetical protein
VIDPGWDDHELLRMQSEAIARGYVERGACYEASPIRTEPDLVAVEGSRSDIFSRPTG